jgi:hypothetical protein
MVAPGIWNLDRSAHCFAVWAKVVATAKRKKTHFIGTPSFLKNSQIKRVGHFLISGVVGVYVIAGVRFGLQLGWTLGIAQNRI